MKTSIIILTYNKLDYTVQCIESIRKYTQKNAYEIIIVDNHSTDGTVNWLNKQEDIKTIYNDKNLGFPKGCNQGIEISSGDNILLLNNDTIVTPGWLNNLVKCLYSSEDIGAAGPITNSAAYYQSIPVSYTNTDEMLGFAKKFNVSDPLKWEERIKLIGFCILIKRKVLEQIGLLDENFTPGNYEDDDICIRIRNAGYKNILCKDTFIHHFGSTSFKNTDYFNLLKMNEKKFCDKWKITIRENMKININLINLIKEEEDTKFNLLEIGCGCGANFLKIGNRYKNAKLFGVDINENALQHCKNAAAVQCCNVEENDIGFNDILFDYVVLDGILAEVKNPIDILVKVKTRLKPLGKILISVPNCMNYKFIFSIGCGNKLQDSIGANNIFGESSNKLFNLQEIAGIIEDNKFEIVNLINTIDSLSESEKQFIDKLCNIFGEDKRQQYITEDYIFSIKSKNEEKMNKLDFDSRKLQFLLMRIENKIDYKSSIEELIDCISKKIINEEIIISYIKEFIIDKQSVLNSVASACFEARLYDCVIPMLKASYDINDEDTNTIYNFGYVLHSFGCDEMALKYLKKDNSDDKGIFKLINEIENKEDKNTNKVSELMPRTKKKLPLVSILIPAYNRANYLDVALSSAVNQTYPNIEIIICDDSTNDEVEKLVKNKYLNKYKQIKYYRNEKNIGQFENDIKLFNYSNGEFINYLMDDDVFTINKIEKMMGYFVSDDKEELSLITSHRSFIDENGIKLEDEGLAIKIVEEDTVFEGTEAGNIILKYNNNFIGEPTTVLFRKKFLNIPFGMYRGRKFGCNVDIATWLNLLKTGKCLYIAETLSLFRKHYNQQQNTYDMVIEGAIDYAYEVLYSPLDGFLKAKEDFLTAVNTCYKYVSYVFNSISINGTNSEKYKELEKYNKYLQKAIQNDDFLEKFHNKDRQYDFSKKVR